jgi:hypothetical protein
MVQFQVLRCQTCEQMLADSLLKLAWDGLQLNTRSVHSNTRDQDFERVILPEVIGGHAWGHLAALRRI